MRQTPLVVLGLALLAAAAWASAREMTPFLPDAAAAAPVTPEEAEVVAQLVAMLPTLPPPDSNCIACHSDAELLQQLAEEKPVTKAPSEGSG